MLHNTPPDIIEEKQDLKPVERAQLPEIGTRKKYIIEDDSDIEVNDNPAELPARAWENNIKKIKDKLDSKTENDGNMTCEPERPRVEEALYQPPTLSKEALMTNILMQTAVNNLEELGKGLNKEIQKSNELAIQWKSHIKALDDYIKSLSKLPWSKVLSYTACFLTIMAFLYKMGVLRMIPDFVSGLLNALPTPSSLTPIKDIGEDIPKPKVDSALNMIMESPITPLALITGVGALAIGFGTLRALVWALRRIPK